MFGRLIHILMIATVLVCPALGGRCCVAAAATAVAPSDQACDHCCCHDQTETKDPLPTPPAEQCHDCFCAGALPPAPSVCDALGDSLLSIGFVIPTSSGKQSTVAQRFSRIEIDSSPPAGRERLTLFCTLLI